MTYARLYAGQTVADDEEVNPDVMCSRLLYI